MPGFDAVGRLALGQLPQPAPAATAPFNQTIWPTAARLKSSAPQHLSVNINLITAPFRQTVWPAAARVKSSPPHPALFNNSMLAAPFPPFRQWDWTPARRTRLASPFLQSQNLTLVASLGPFRQQDFASPKYARRSTPSQASLNLNLIANLGPFTQTNWTAPQRSLAALALAPVNVPLLVAQSTPFANFAFVGAVRARLNLPVYPYNVALYTPIVDTHDGVWVKRKRKRGPDPIELEIEEKAKRRAALELAVYGPEVEYQEPPALVAPTPVMPPDVSDLAKVIAQAQVAQYHAARLQSDLDDEDDLESILREIL